MVWAGVDSEGAQKLAALAKYVVSEMSELGFRSDKLFSAHMTILRSRDRRVNASYICSEYQGRTFASGRIEKMHIKKSKLTPSGPEYSNVYTVEAKK